MMTTIRCPQILTICGKNYNCCSLFMFDNTNGKRKFTTGSTLRRKSHYDVLGLTPKATQVDVKSAYYNLSKIFHPDKNEGSADAAQKFRDINSAYEILGNYKLRRLYDKGIVHTAGAQYQDVDVNVEVPDDAQTKFYKRHMKRTEAPPASGRTPIYDFDEWNEKHYGIAFQRSQSAKKRYTDRPVEAESAANSVKYEITILGGMFVLTVTLYLIMLYESSTPDDISATTKVR